MQEQGPGGRRRDVNCDDESHCVHHATPRTSPSTSLTQMKYEIDCFPNGRQFLKT